MFIFHFKTISGSIRSLWGSMGFYGVSMGFYGVLWGSMGLYGVKRRTGTCMVHVHGDFGSPTFKASL